MTVKKIAVFCGSSLGDNPEFKKVAALLGEALAEKEMKLIYGGAKVGIMGTIADSALEKGAEVIGVMPHSLHEREIFHEGLTELHIVDTMHERKQMMMDLADGFIVFPGGVGTMEEFFEVFTWNMIGVLNKPCILFNTIGYYDLLIQFFDEMTKQGFLQPQIRQQLIVVNTVEEIFENINSEYKNSTKNY